MKNSNDPCIHCQLLEDRNLFLAQNQNPASDRTPKILHEQYDKDLQASLDRFMRLCDAAFEGIVIHDQGIFIESNQQFADMFGYTLEEIKGLNGFNLFAPQCRQLANEKIASNYEGIYQAIGLRKDGTQFPVEVRARKSRLNGRDVRIAACRDMTPQKQVENQLFLKQEELRAVFESSADCILVWDRDCNYLYANKAAIDHVKTTPDQVIGKNIRDGLGHIPEFMQLWRSRVELVFETGKPLRLTDAMPVGDKFVYSESVLSPIRHPNGDMFAVGVVYRDITEQKLAEIEIKAGVERFKRFYETSFEAIVIHKNGQVLDANQKFYTMFGYATEDLRHLNGIELIAPQSREIVAKNIASGYSEIYEVKGLKKDGTVFPIEIQAREILINGESHRIGAIKDLTRRKAMEQQLIESEKKYRELYDYAQIPLYRTRISDGKLIECNLAMVSLLGYDSKEDCLRNYYSAAHYVNPAKRVELLEALKKGKSVSGFEIEITRCNGAHAWVEVTAKLYPVQGYIEGTQFDITVSKVLSRAEKKILTLIMQGHGNKQIAQFMKRSTRTIEDHRSHIMQKLGVSNLVELTKITQFMKPEREKEKKK